MKKSFPYRILRSFLFLCLAILILSMLVVGGTNLYVIKTAQSRIITESAAFAMGSSEAGPQCIEVLGAGINYGRPSSMLAARLDTGMALYRGGAGPILLFSGDNGSDDYNEVAAMKRYALENGESYGIDDSVIYLDYAGFSTYDSMYRLREVFQAKHAIIVTQKYHLYRAIYDANRLGIDAYGVAAEPKKNGQFYRDVREVLARTKDFFYVMFDAQPKYLGEPVPLVLPSTQAASSPSGEE